MKTLLLLAIPIALIVGGCSASPADLDPEQGGTPSILFEHVERFHYHDIYVTRPNAPLQCILLYSNFDAQGNSLQCKEQ